MRVRVHQRALLLNLPLAEIAEDVEIVGELLERPRTGAEEHAIVDVVLVGRVGRLGLGRMDRRHLRGAVPQEKRVRPFHLRQVAAQDVGNPAVGRDDRPDLPHAGDFAVLRAVDRPHVPAVRRFELDADGQRRRDSSPRSERKAAGWRARRIWLRRQSTHRESASRPSPYDPSRRGPRRGTFRDAARSKTEAGQSPPLPWSRGARPRAETRAFAAAAWSGRAARSTDRKT